MSGTTDTGDSYTDDSTGKTQGSVSYIFGITIALIILLITLSYVSYKCSNRRTRSSSPTGGDSRRQLMTVSGGVSDEVLMNFPAFVYSGDMMPKMGEAANGSGCSICLSDYKAADVIRLLPECGHLFHRQCIDTWLKVHASCPVCRNSPLPVKVSIQRS